MTETPTNEYMTFTQYCTDLFREKMDVHALQKQLEDLTGFKAKTPDFHFAYPIWHALNQGELTELSKKAFLSIMELQQNKNIPVEALEYFHHAWKSYRQTEALLEDFRDAGFNSITKNRLYRLPLYSQLMDDVLTPLLKAVSLLLGDSEKTLGNLVLLMKLNRLGHLVQDIDPTLVEAIHEGRVLQLSEGKIMGFSTLSGTSMLQKSYSVMDFDDMLERLQDLANGLVLGFAAAFSEKGIHFLANKLESSIKNAFDQLSMKLSIPGLCCTSLSDTSLEQAQLNIHMDASVTDPNFLICSAFEVVSQIFEMYPGYHRYLVNFDHDRLAIAYVRITAEQMTGLNEDYSRLEQYVEEMILNGEINIANPSEEAIDLEVIAAYHYPTKTTEHYKIKTVENISTKNRKRFMADLYVGDAHDQETIRAYIQEAIDWIKQVRNVPVTKTPTKNGTMDADSIYLNVYRHDRRASKRVNAENDNFICFVDYNVDGKSTLKNGRLQIPTWNQLHKEQSGFMNLAWRDASHAGKSAKVGRNEPCPCGSGKKYKKCHG